MQFFKSPVLYGVLILVVMATGGYTTYEYQKSQQVAAVAAPTFKTPEESDAPVRFVMEGYDIIQSRHWKGATDADLAQHFLLSVNKAASVTETLPSNDRAGVAKIVAKVMLAKDEVTKRKIAVDTLTIALVNLAPVGRAQLLTSQAQTQLQNTVANVNPQKDLYAALGLQKDAETTEVKQAYEEKVAELAATTSPTKEKDLEEVAYAHTVLADEQRKDVYDTTKVEPTVFSHKPNAKTLYIFISSMAPTTQSEFERAVKAVEADSAITSLILDLRGNIGGDLTFAQTFLGLFLGPNQYAFDIFMNGKYEVQRTVGLMKMPALDRLREIAVLTDNMSQSTAEVITASLKRGHMARVVGGTTRGWGSIEQIIPMQTVIDPAQTYAIEMVVGLTVRDDAQPIEGNGVVPDVAISDPEWKNKLADQFYSPQLISAIKSLVSAPPKK
jgi:Peptidase family S41/DnaJ domain